MKRIISIFLTICALLGVLALPISADGGTARDIATSDVLSDLAGYKIGGNAFDAEKYPLKTAGSPQLLAFYETGYEARGLCEDYALYVYVYNPVGRTVTSDGCTVTCALTCLETDVPQTYDTYSLALISESADHRFLKFKIEGLTLDDRADVRNYARVRNYYFSEVTLQYTGDTNGTAGKLGKRIIFRGAGSGTSYTEQNFETVELSVGFTSYVVQNGKNVSSMITSAYFSVPNAYLTQYGRLNRIKYQMRKRYSQPLYVTTNADFWTAVSDYSLTGQYANQTTKYGWGYFLKTDSEFLPGGASHTWSVYDKTYHFDGMCGTYKPAGLSYTLPDKYASNSKLPGFNYIKKINSLDTNGDGLINCADVLISSKDLTEFFGLYGRNAALYDQNSPFDGGGALSVTNLYADSKMTVKGFDSGLSLVNWWKSKFSNLQTDDLEYQMIQAVSETDMIQYATDFAKRFAVSPLDIGAVSTAAKKAAKEDSTLFLMRFDVSDYAFYQNHVFDTESKTLCEEIELYGMQVPVFRNFDIIELEFIQEDAATVIPVVMSPVDYVPSGVAGIEDNNIRYLWNQKDGSGLTGCAQSALTILRTVALLLLLLLLCRPILWILRGIGKLLSKCSADRARRKERRNERKGRKK